MVVVAVVVVVLAGAGLLTAAALPRGRRFAARRSAAVASLRRRPRSERRSTTPPPRPGLVGTTAPPITGQDTAGHPVGRGWDDPSRQIVAFLTGGCSSCQGLWAALADGLARRETGGLPVVVVTPSPGTESRRGVAARAAGGTAVIMSTEAWLAYGVRGAPWFVVVDSGRVRAEGHATSWAGLRAMVTV